MKLVIACTQSELDRIDHYYDLMMSANDIDDYDAYDAHKDMYLCMLGDFFACLSGIVDDAVDEVYKDVLDNEELPSWTIKRLYHVIIV